MKIKLKRIANVKSFKTFLVVRIRKTTTANKIFCAEKRKRNEKAAENSRKRFRTSKPKRQQNHSNSDGGRGAWAGMRGGKKLAVSINEPYKQDFRCFCFVFVVFTPSRRITAKSIRLIRFQYFCFCFGFLWCRNSLKKNSLGVRVHVRRQKGTAIQGLKSAHAVGLLRMWSKICLHPGGKTRRENDLEKLFTRSFYLKITPLDPKILVLLTTDPIIKNQFVCGSSEVRNWNEF